MSRTETKGLSERERQRQNRIPVIAHTYHTNSFLGHLTVCYFYGCIFLKVGLIGSSFVQE